MVGLGYSSDNRVFADLRECEIARVYDRLVESWNDERF